MRSSIFSRIALVLVVLLAALGAAQAQTLDVSTQTVVNTNQNVSTVTTPSFSTTGANRICVAYAMNQSSSGLGVNNPVTITSSPALTWNSRFSHFLSGEGIIQELWALAATSFTGTVTMTAGHNWIDGWLVVACYSGVGNLAAPFDTNASLPADIFSTTNVDAATVTISTDNALTVLTWFGSESSPTYSTNCGTVNISPTGNFINTNGDGTTFMFSAYSRQNQTNTITAGTYGCGLIGGPANMGFPMFLMDALAGSSSAGSAVQFQTPISYQGEKMKVQQ